MMELLTMEFPLGREIMTSVRLATGGICALAGFGLDAAEDCKVCVTEGLLLLLGRGCERAKVSFTGGEKLLVALTGEGSAPSDRSVEEEISIALLSALVDDLEIKKEENGARITFGFSAL